MAESDKLNSAKNSSSDVVPGHKEQILCQPCSGKDLQTTADVFCSECDEFQCNVCSKAHTVYAFKKNHKLVHVTEVKLKPTFTDMKGMDNCEQHGELLKFFFEHENKLLANKSFAPVDPIVKLTKITSIKLKKTVDDTREPLYSGLDFLPDGRLVAVDNYNKKCLIYNEKLTKVGSFQLSYRPQSVVAISEEEVAITRGNQYKIDFLRVSKSNEITLLRTCKVKTEYDSICLKDERNFVVGTIDNTRPVRIVSMSGDEKDFNISFPNKTYSLNDSACNYITNTEKMILTDRYEHTVYIYDVATNTRVVVRDDQIKEPLGVAVGPSDCLLVCSMRTHTIVQISATGRIISSYKLDMKFPATVCVSKDKAIIAVTNCSDGKRRLQLFKFTGLVQSDPAIVITQV